VNAPVPYTRATGSRQGVRFSPFCLDFDRGILWRGTEPVALRPKAWALLCYLVENHGRLATKAELLDAIWPAATVNEAALANCISELRAALGDDRRDPHYIEIAHRRGYRWIATIESSPNGHAEPSAMPLHPHVPPPPAVTVGRDEELEQLRGALTRALAAQRQLVFITGEAGIGKSTLLDRFLASGAVRAELPLVGRGQCVEQQTAGEPCLPLLEAVAELCRQAGSRVVDVLRQHAPMWLAQLPAFLSSAERRSIHSEIGGAARERMLRELGDAIDILALATPLVLALEDLHWADRGTVDMLSYLARRRAPARLLVVGTYRPVNVLVSNHPLKRVKRDLQARQLADEIALSFLTEAAVEQLLRARFPDNDLPAELARFIHQQTDGNPLFMVALMDFLVGRDWIAYDGRWRLTVPLAQIHVGIPDSLKHMIERQIDECPPGSIRLLELASLLGGEFASQPLAVAAESDQESVEAQCDVLAEKQQIVRAVGVSEWPDGTVGSRYAFVHTLYQKALSDRLAPARRRRLHQRIAERIEGGWGGRTEEVCTELAAHFDRGGDRRRAVKYLRESAARALQRGSLGDARLAIEKALALVAGGAETADCAADTLALTIALAASMQATQGYADPEVEAVLQRILDMSEQLGAAPQRFAALIGLCANAYFRGRHAECAARAGELLDMDATLGLPGMSQAAQFLAGLSRHAEGRFDEARDRLEASLRGAAWPSPFARPDFRVSAVTLLGRVETLLGFPERGADACRRGAALARDIGPYDMTFAYCLAATHGVLVRHAGNTRQVIEDAIELIEQYGFDRLRHYADAHHGWAIAMHTHTPEGIATIRTALTRRQELGFDGETAWLACLMAMACLDAGRVDEARDATDTGIACATRTGERWIMAELYRLRGECARAGAVARDATHWFEQAIKMAQAQGARWWELRATTSLTRLHAGTRHASAATARLQTICDWFTEGTDTADLREARALLD